MMVFEEFSGELFESSREAVERAAEVINKNLRNAINNGAKIVTAKELLEGSGIPYNSDSEDEGIYIYQSNEKRFIELKGVSK